MGSPINFRQFSGPDLVIPNAGTDSNAINSDTYGGADAITIMAPSALTGTCTIQVNEKKDGSGTWRSYQQVIGTDLTIAASKAVTIRPVPGHAIRIHSGSSEASPRTFNIILNL